jgi:hypothetical protein
MKTLPAMVDMRRTPEEMKECGYPCPPSSGDEKNEPVDFYGLSISLENPELKKLGLDTEGCEPGDMIHMQVMAVVTSISKTDTQGAGPRQRLELTLRHIAAEDEDNEAEAVPRKSPSKIFYRSEA